MAQSLSVVYTHLIFATKYKHARIDPSIASDLYSYIGGICRKLDCPSIAVHGVPGHIHILCKLSRNISIAELIRKVKQSSSKWIKSKVSGHGDFQWQSGYAAFSIGQSGVKTLVSYINNKEAHHKNRTFQDEYREFLKKYRVEFDEGHLWE